MNYSLGDWLLIVVVFIVRPLYVVIALSYCLIVILFRGLIEFRLPNKINISFGLPTIQKNLNPQ